MWAPPGHVHACNGHLLLVRRRWGTVLLTRAAAPPPLRPCRPRSRLSLTGRTAQCTTRTCGARRPWGPGGARGDWQGRSILRLVTAFTGFGSWFYCLTLFWAPRRDASCDTPNCSHSPFSKLGGPAIEVVLLCRIPKPQPQPQATTATCSLNDSWAAAPPAIAHTCPHATQTAPKSCEGQAVQDFKMYFYILQLHASPGAGVRRAPPRCARCRQARSCSHTEN
jgi:hypothetical protein